MKIRIPAKLAKELNCKADGTAICPQCGKLWHSPYPKTRRVCPECYKRITGYSYIQ